LGSREGLWDAGIVQKFTAIMPDPQYSREGHTRVILYEGLPPLLRRLREGRVLGARRRSRCTRRGAY
jgi:hypothetical protein